MVYQVFVNFALFILNGRGTAWTASQVHRISFRWRHLTCFQDFILVIDNIACNAKFWCRKFKRCRLLHFLIFKDLFCVVSKTQILRTFSISFGETLKSIWRGQRNMRYMRIFLIYFVMKLVANVTLNNYFYNFDRTKSSALRLGC